jgi:predicted RecB family nuclease
MRHVLSKSTFLYGSQCTKRLYFYKFRRDLLVEISAAQQAIFDRGTSVGHLARDLFPGGKDASPATPFEYEKSVRLTKELIEAGTKVIYEAAFQYQGVLAAVDILVKRNGKWKAYEVKSSTSVKDVNVMDASLQYHVTTKSGIELADIFIVYLNNEYVRKKDVVPEELFAMESVKAEALENQAFVKEKIKELKEILVLKKEPKIDIGPHCQDPYSCDFIHHCWKHVPEPSVFSLSRLGTSKKFELYEQGIISFEDLPEDVTLTEFQQLQVEGHLNGNSNIDKPEIKNFLKDLSYPLYFMDFETFQAAVPLYKKSRPYQQIPFQYSLHYKKSKNTEPKHFEFLAEPTEDPRKHFIEKLLEDTSSPGKIITYNVGFEKAILNNLARDFPKYKKDIEERCDRLLDLMVPFRKGWYYKPEMNGSYSIKQVLPALVPELNYNEMEIADGSSASLAYEQMVYDPNSDTEAIRQQLLAYCKLDTFAMVRMLDVLEKV